VTGAGAGYSSGIDAPTSSAPRVAVFAPAPVLVCTFEYPHDESDPEVALNVGGQGPWVARAIDALGAHAVLVVPLGGATGTVARHLLEDEPHEVRVVAINAAIACYLEERREGERHCIRDAPPGRFGQRELDDVYSAALTAGLDADVCVITGSPWEDHVDASLLTRLTRDLSTLGRTTVADLSGAQLDAALAGGVDWLKIADDELDATHLDDAGDDEGDGNGGDDADGDGGDEVWARARALANAHDGRRSVIVSRAERPSLVVTPDGRFTVSAPGLSTVDARGSGDAMTAALATGLAADLPTEALLRRAAAAGAANAVHKGSATPDLELVDRLAEEIEVTDVGDGDGG
jgi:1-phosphofructokinase